VTPTARLLGVRSALAHLEKLAAEGKVVAEDERYRKP
jgi:hypothetical protein